MGNKSLGQFDVCIIGSGSGGGSAAHVLTAANKNVLVLEAGDNSFDHLDDPDRSPLPRHSNDELKYSLRNYIAQDGFLEPRTFRTSTAGAGTLQDDVNVLPKAVGGAFQHADCKTPRFNSVDFQLKTAMEQILAATPGLAVPGFGADAASANFADWPLTYESLEPFYVEAEQLYGVQGDTGANIYQSPRSGPYPMPPGVPMYLGVILSDGARRTTVPGVGPLSPHPYPAAITSRFYGAAPDVRPPCVDCGLCSGFGCPNNSKGSPAVTTLRRALLSGRCQLRHNAQVTRLLMNGTGSQVTGVEYVDADGSRQTVTASVYVLAASAIESARLCFLSGPSPSEPIGNRSGQVGQNLMFHLQTNVNGFLPQRVHGQRGRAVTNGISDFRGVEPGGAAIRVLTDGMGNPVVAMGGICEFSASQGLPVSDDGLVYTLRLPGQYGIRFGSHLKNALRDQALGQHLFGLLMQAEDAPQRTNFVDLDTRYKDVYGLPVARVTYSNHGYELMARKFYLPFMKQVVTNAGSTAGKIFVAPINYDLVGPPSSRHIMGTLRMGTDPAGSVTDPTGRFHDVENLYACDGSVFPTSSGYNPTLTIMAVALRIAHGMVGTTPARV